MPGSMMEQPAPKNGAGRRGRPPVLSLEERSRRILAAGEQVFTRDGYGATTMEEVARMAGMSKKTVYGLYPDKEHLFAAVVSDVDAFPNLKPSRSGSKNSPRDELRDRLLAMAEFVLSRRQVAMTRLLISEADHTPQLADEFYARVMSKGQTYLTDSLTHMLKSEGVTTFDDVENTSMALFSAALGGLHLAALLGKQKEFARTQLLAQIDLAMEMVAPNLLRRSYSRVRSEQCDLDTDSR